MLIMVKPSKLSSPIEIKSIKRNLKKYLSKKYPKNEKNNYINSLTIQTVKNIEKWLNYQIPNEFKEVLFEKLGVKLIPIH